jgi:DNA repair exonuclease SbcCD ATPase subunit/DNA repair exonuclease SbcCD nuclease subunit
MLIAHISDIHIRNYARHWEYRKAFENLYVSLREKKPDLIVLTGDTAHTKTKIAPEFVDVCAEFFDNLGDITHTIIIPGNHDGNLNNLTRMDAISPVVEALGHPNITFHKDSGICSFKNLNFVVFSCFDKNWPTAEEIQEYSKARKDSINIGLYHGFVDGARLQNNMIVRDCPHKVEDFLKLVDYLLLGDIHKQQYLDLKRRSAYAGSLIQQNYGESLHKGYLLWNIESKKKHDVEEVVLPNVCPFHTVKLDNDLKIPDVKIQPNSRIRILSRQLSVLEKNMLRERFTDQFDPNRLDWLDDVSPHRQELQIDKETTKMENLEDLGIQEKLLTKFLEQYELSDETIEKILEINRRYNTHIRKNEDVLRNVLYRIGKLKFSNTFSFAEGNEIDFPNYRGLLGVFGKSGVGKSSAVVDVPLYCMFNKISKRVTKNDWIINENKEMCSAEMEIFLRDKMYKIERVTSTFLKSGKKKGKPVYQGRTDVDFRSFDENGVEQELNGTERSDTDAEIRKLFGNSDDFIATSVAPQWKLLNVVEAGGTDRQKLIGRYFDIDIFNQKHILAKEELKETNAKLRTYGSMDLENELEDAEKRLEEINKKIEENGNEKAFQETRKKLLDDRVAKLKEKIVPVGSHRSEEELNKQIAFHEKNLKTYKENLKRIKELDAPRAEEDLAKHTHVKFLRDQAESLRGSCSCKHEKGCLLAKEINKLLKQATQTEKKIKYSEEECLGRAREERKIKNTMTKSDETIEFRLKAFKEELKEVKKNKKQLEKNEKAEIKVIEVMEELTKTNDLLKEALEASLSLSKDLGAAQSVYTTIKGSMDEYAALRADYEAFDYFMRAMSKDGIVRQIIANNLGIINSEIEKILSHGVGFTVRLESNEDGKAIDIFFKHERSPKRHIELCSGMEKTLAEVAIRAALVNITTLPRSNIFMLDESFGALDPEYMAGLTRILEHLKTLFETVVIITHSDELRDFVDHVIEVERDENGYARLT